jgi:hypothetical protein
MTTAIAKRVIVQLTPAEHVIRVIQRATEIRDASRARADADYVERVEEALRSLRPDDDSEIAHEQQNGSSKLEPATV